MKGPAVVRQRDGGKHAVFGTPHVVLPNSHDLFFSNPDTTGALDVSKWSVSHYLAGHFRYCRVSCLSVSLCPDQAYEQSYFLTNTQSRNTAFDPAAPDEKVLMFRTGNTGTSPNSSAAREST